MASSLLQQAVTLAQQGQRDEAARLLRQFVQTNPDHEVAWLWLASVAANQPEYVRALNEVLRVNPENARAHRLLDDFNQQYGSIPAAAMPSVSPVIPAGAGPVRVETASDLPPAYVATGTPVPTPPANFAAPARDAYAQPAYNAQPPSQVRYVTGQEIVVKKPRGCLGCLPGCSLGCGCWQGCLLLLVLIVLLPVLSCVGLSFLPETLGPLDWLAAYLPGHLGRKTIEMTVDDTTVQLTVPRSWQIAEDQNEWWEMGREILIEILPFEDSAVSWYDFEAEVGKATRIMETDPGALMRGGGIIYMEYAGKEAGRYDCETVRKNAADFDAAITYANNLCGWRDHSLAAWLGDKLTSFDPPEQTRTVEFRVPISESEALLWYVFVPENMYSNYRGDIDALIEKAEIVDQAAP